MFFYFLFFIFLLISCNKISLEKQALFFETTKKYSQAIEKYNLYLKKVKNNSNAYTGRGHCKYHLNDFDGCIQDMTSAIEINNLNARAFDLKGLCEYKKQDYSNAITDFTIALKLDPSNKLTKKDLADCKKLIQDNKNSQKTAL